MLRREFLSALAAAGLSSLSGCAAPERPPLPSGELLGGSLDIGHLLRDPGSLPPPSAVERVPVLIVGAGIGGLSAGWRLARSGYRAFRIVELEAQSGGHSRAGHNAVSAYPLAAHYLPLPTRESTAVRELLAELGVLHGDPRAARPRYDERYLCAAPQERLYRNGRWQDGLRPHAGVGEEAEEQFQRFYTLMEAFRQRRDGGRRAFALPMALSSRAPDLLALDRVTMREWLLAQGLDAPDLHWVVNYACRDDYGTDYAEVSAWAGIHYYASRNGEAEDAAGDTVLTTPGGNAWLADGLLQSIRRQAGERVQTGAVVYRVGEGGGRYEVDLWLPGEGRSLRLVADQLIWAAPLYLVPHVFAGAKRLHEAARRFSYAPWLVANLTLSRFPEDRSGASMSWDNVLFDSPGLGYVVATHQTLRRHQGQTVFTYYRALSDQMPSQGRQALQEMPHAFWAEQVLADLERPHPDIRQVTTRLDVVRHGHAMARPTPGLIFGPARRLFAVDRPNLHFAHADVSGFSLFEEAQYRGVLAAERTLRRLGRGFVSLLG